MHKHFFLLSALSVFAFGCQCELKDGSFEGNVVTHGWDHRDTTGVWFGDSGAVVKATDVGLGCAADGANVFQCKGFSEGKSTTVRGHATAMVQGTDPCLEELRTLNASYDLCQIVEMKKDCQGAKSVTIRAAFNLVDHGFTDARVFAFGLTGELSAYRGQFEIQQQGDTVKCAVERNLKVNEWKSVEVELPLPTHAKYVAILVSVGHGAVQSDSGKNFIDDVSIVFKK